MGVPIGIPCLPYLVFFRLDPKKAVRDHGTARRHACFLKASNGAGHRGSSSRGEQCGRIELARQAARPPRPAASPPSTQDTHSPSPGLGLTSSLATGRRDWDCGPCWVGGTGPGLGLQSLGFRGTGLGLGLQSHPVLRDWDFSPKPRTKYL